MANWFTTPLPSLCCSFSFICFHFVAIHFWFYSWFNNYKRCGLWFSLIFLFFLHDLIVLVLGFYVMNMLIHCVITFKILETVAFSILWFQSFLVKFIREKGIILYNLEYVFHWYEWLMIVMCCFCRTNALQCVSSTHSYWNPLLKVLHITWLCTH